MLPDDRMMIFRGCDESHGFSINACGWRVEVRDEAEQMGLGNGIVLMEGIDVISEYEIDRKDALVKASCEKRLKKHENQL